MKKNGFVSTSIIYTFFFVFLLLMLFLLNSYSSVRFLLENYKYDIRNDFAESKFADVNLIIMVRDNNTNEYEIRDSLPPFGYNYNSSISYCKNSSAKPVYSNGNISITVNRKDICYAYFDPIEKDITVRLYTVDSKGNSNLVKTIPSLMYTLDTDSSSCTNGATYKFDPELRRFQINAPSKTLCSFYFKKKEADVIVRVFKQDNNGMPLRLSAENISTKYIEVNDVPGSNFTFSGYSCLYSGTTITYDNEIVVDTTVKNECNVYFDGESGTSSLIYMVKGDDGEYKRVVSMPDSTYQYTNNYSCDYALAKVIYKNGTFTIESTKQTTCKVYFDKVNGSVRLNYYIEKVVDSGEYEYSTYVPDVGYKYDHGSCKNGSTINIKDGVVIVDNQNKEDTCDLYYKRIKADIIVNVMVRDRNETSSTVYKKGDVPTSGYKFDSWGCVGGNGSLEYKNGRLHVSSEGPTTCTVYFY